MVIFTHYLLINKLQMMLAVKAPTNSLMV